MKKKRLLAVRYELYCGNFMFNFVAICTGEHNQKNEDIVDEYFKLFYGEGELDDTDYEKCDNYSYQCGQIVIEVQGWKKITVNEHKFLINIGVY